MMLCSPALAQRTHPVITSISVCSSSGTGGAGSCTSGAFDTHRIVLAPDGSGNAFNSYNTAPPGAAISVIGLRAKSDGTLTTIPVLTK